jgi:FlaA1/EpsC-like NDP-sugar epimerase
MLFRKEIDLIDDATVGFYSGKTVLITGGGGSIGSELTRQIANMHPERIVILDEYENGAYVVQQELLLQYGTKLKLDLEIISVCNRPALERVFEKYRPDIVLHAAAHKHVPLMEHNCCEAVKNNVFGTLNTVDMAVKYGAGRFIMISTDKAVNPTNVMGATKRMCEMIVQSRSTQNTGTVFSCTRFGNVLGSAGSVIPLFKRQIAKGGPVTITDKRIIRYFMTIPEASQLVLQSGAMAKSGELFVLDMGKPVRILDMAENMIRLSGKEPYRDIDIVETGLRPGEKLYEELLIKSEDLDKTDNSMIFVERDTPLSAPEIKERLDILREAVSTNDDKLAKEAMRRVVPTFRKPEVVNAEAAKSEEMNAAL